MTNIHQPRYMFARVPTFETFTGDKRIWTTPQRKVFVWFALDLETMRGLGFKAGTLPEAKAAADYFAAKLELPDGTKIV